MFRAQPWPVIQRQRAGLQAAARRSGARQAVEGPDCTVEASRAFFSWNNEPS